MTENKLIKQKDLTNTTPQQEKKKLSLGKNVEKLALPAIAGGNVKWSSIWKTVMTVPQKS